MFSILADPRRSRGQANRDARDHQLHRAGKRSQAGGLLDDKAESLADRVGGFVLPPPGVADLADQQAIAEGAERARRDEALLTERVALARAHGRSWNRIAAALGVSRQAARQRFGGKVGT